MVWRLGTVGLEVGYYSFGGWVLVVLDFGYHSGCISGGATGGR